MFISEYFKTPVWSEEKPEFVKSLNKASDKYIKVAKKTAELMRHWLELLNMNITLIIANIIKS